MNSFISYNLRFQISPFAQNGVTHVLPVKHIQSFVCLWPINAYWYALEGERDLGGQSPDTLHDIVHDQCATTPRADRGLEK